MVRSSPMEGRRNPLDKLSGEGLIRGIANGLQRLFAPVLDDPLPGEMRELVRRIGKRRKAKKSFRPHAKGDRDA